MKRSALAVVLVFSVHHLASAQHQGTSSSSSSSSGSSGSYNGGSAGYSGGGGGSYHSSGSSGGSSGYGGSSGTYSGGSHSSASSGSISGGYSGGSRSPASVTSPSNPGSHSGGSSQGSHSNTHAVFSGSSGNIPGGSRDTSSHSNIRVSDGVDGNAAKIGSGENSRPGFTPGMIFQSSPSKTMSDPRRPNSIQDEAWMHQPFQIEVPSETPDKKTLAHILAERGREVGLEPTKSAYKQTMTPLSGPEPHHVSWVGKLFGAKPTLTKTTPGSQLRPCRGEDCGKNPRPKPCLGANCPKPGPPPKPLPPKVGAVCRAGYRGANGTCRPWGYIRDCTYDFADPSPGNCRIHWASVDSSYCLQILEEIRHQQMLLQQTRFAQGMACSTAPQGQGCAELTHNLEEESAQIRQLQQQYRMCTLAAGRYAAPFVSSPSSWNSWPTFPWP